MMTDVHAKVIAAIYDITRPDKPDLSDHDAPLLAGALDSLDFASMLMALEDEFGFALADEDAEQLGTINKLVAFIEAKQAA
jgi:acyl carrier protein